MRADEWIEKFAAEIGTREPDEEKVGELLELAASAAHGSERIAAPIACYLAGVTGAPLGELRSIADRISPAEAD
jgi:hypothetical protein